MIVPEADKRVLESLAEHKYLTASQMVQLGIRTDTSNVNKVLRKMKHGTGKVIDEVSSKELGGGKDIENIYFLTKKGVSVLTGILEYDANNVRIPHKNKEKKLDSYFHRRDTITYSIHFHTWAKENGIDIELYKEYFEKEETPVGTRDKTWIFENDGKSVNADSLCRFNKDGQQHSFLMELHRGNDVKKFEWQFLERAEAIAEDALKKRLELTTERHTKMVWVFEHDSTMKVAMRRVWNNPVYAGLKDIVLFKTVQEVEREFGSAWHTCDGRTVDFFGQDEKIA